MTRDRRWLWGFATLAVIAVLGAVVVKLTGQRPPYWVGCAVGFFCVLMAAGAVCVEFAKLTSWRRLIPRAGAVILISSTAEIVGVYTGWPFGIYSYTHLWLPLVDLPAEQRFPIALPITWLILSGATMLFLGDRKRAPFIGGLLMALIDFALEPVLTGPVGFWRWKDGDPPLINYLGWFFVGLAVCAILRVPRESKPPTQLAATLLYVILAGTLAIGLSHGEPRGLYALVPAAAIAYLTRRPKS